MGSGCRQRRVGVAADYLSMITISEHKNLGPKNSDNAIPLAPAVHVCNYHNAGSDLFIYSCRSQRCRQRPALRPTTAHPVSACVACSDRRRAVVERQDVCLADTEIGVRGDKGCAPVVDKQLHLPQSHTPFITTKPRHVKSVCNQCFADLQVCQIIQSHSIKTINEPTRCPLPARSTKTTTLLLV